MSKYRFPKIDLHLHLDGSMLPESAWEMAAERGIALPADTLEDFRHFIVVTADCRSVNAADTAGQGGSRAHGLRAGAAVGRAGASVRGDTLRPPAAS